MKAARASKANLFISHMGKRGPREDNGLSKVRQQGEGRVRSRAHVSSHHPTNGHGTPLSTMYLNCEVKNYVENSLNLYCSEDFWLIRYILNYSFETIEQEILLRESQMFATYFKGGRNENESEFFLGFYFFQLAGEELVVFEMCTLWFLGRATRKLGCIFLRTGHWFKDSHCTWMLTTTDVKYTHAGEYQTKAEPPEDLSPRGLWLNRKADKAITILHGIDLYSL